MTRVESFVSGSVVSVDAAAGTSVQAGDVLAVVESMKMEIPIEVERAGVVRAILVKVGDTIAEGQVVAEIE